MLEQKKFRKVAPVRTLVSELPRELDALFSSVFEPDPKERITDALSRSPSLSASPCFRILPI